MSNDERMEMAWWMADNDYERLADGLPVTAMADMPWLEDVLDDEHKIGKWLTSQERQVIHWDLLRYHWKKHGREGDPRNGEFDEYVGAGKGVGV